MNRLGTLVRTRSLPRMTVLEHRWEWIAHGLVPGFRCYEEKTGSIAADLREIFASLAALERKAGCAHAS